MIDLNSHKNNIRKRGKEEESGIKHGGDDEDDKKKVKCKYFPKCKLSDEECPFFHPKE